MWAIGTGRVASAADAQEVCKAIRDELGRIASPNADAVRVLYGGSANAKNIGELIAGEDVDGALVGGASLDGEQVRDHVGDRDGWSAARPAALGAVGQAATADQVVGTGNQRPS